MNELREKAIDELLNFVRLSDQAEFKSLLASFIQSQPINKELGGRPDKNSDYYQLTSLKKTENSVTSIPFDHVRYEDDLEIYCDELEQKIKQLKGDNQLQKLQLEAKKSTWIDDARDRQIKELNGWISVEDRLPEDNKTVILSYYSGGSILWPKKIKHIKFASCVFSESGERVFKVDEGSFPPLYKCKYWMPLPNPPKK